MTITSNFMLSAVDAQTTSVQEISRKLKHNGGVIVKGLISADVLQEVGNDIKPYFHQGWDNELFSNKTRVVSSLPRKSSVFVEKMFGNQLYSDVCDAFLTSHHEAWIGDSQYTFESPPIYNASVAFSTLPGNDPQRLHRDDMDHHARRPAISPEEYTIGRDIVITTFVADTRTTKENGATRFIPGSHLQDSLQKPDESQAVYVELDPGDAFIMLASCYHAASTNMTESEERVLYSMFMTKSFLRQTENVYLSLPLEILRTFSPRMQKRLGFSASNPISGWIDLQDPRDVLGLPGPSMLKQIHGTYTAEATRSLA